MASLSEADQLLLKNNPSLTNADIKTYNVKKAKLFKLTISICAIYGTLAIVILLLTLFSSQGSQIFTEEVRPFTLTFVGGMIIVIILLIIQIVSFKPIALSTSTFDKDRCPDFWKLVKTPDNDPIYSSATNDIKQLLAYKCVPDTNILQTYRPFIPANGASASNAKNFYGQTIYNNNKTYKTITPDTNNVSLTKLLGSSGNDGLLTTGSFNFNNGSATTNTLQCDQVFPNYLANKNVNDTDIQDTPNILACEYAKQCNIPWTSQCGN
jgi:hypothetical protein